jgi:DNA-3-methyladenine glycosylase
MGKLPLEFYRQEDVLILSQRLIGKRLMTFLDGRLTGGRIIETEAYRGPEDRACHAYNNRRTQRTEVMFHAGGISYVYLCYGMHTLFNVVTGPEEMPHAILIRAIEPTDGIEWMLKRRNKTHQDKTLCTGPGTVCQALGIQRYHNGESLIGDHIWIEDEKLYNGVITSTPRIGVDYAQEDALLPWRFVLVNLKE